MTTLNATLIQDFSRNFQRSARTIHGLVEPLTEDQVWTNPYTYGNSIGNLVLHLTGNLNYYLGAEMGGTGYARNRPLEFDPASRIAKTELMKRFDEAIAVVVAVLAKQTEGDWGSSYSAKGLEEIGDRLSMILQCAAHLYHHTGQIMYLVRELEKQHLTTD